MNGPLDEAESATPLTPEEREGLIPSHITLRNELNELEQQNILEAASRYQSVESRNYFLEADQPSRRLHGFEQRIQEAFPRRLRR